MKILVIDTSGPVCGTAVMDEEKVYSEFTAQNRNTHSVNLMPMVEAALHAAGAELKDLEAIAAVTGYDVGGGGVALAAHTVAKRQRGKLGVCVCRNVLFFRTEHPGGGMRLGEHEHPVGGAAHVHQNISQARVRGGVYGGQGVLGILRAQPPVGDAHDPAPHGGQFAVVGGKNGRPGSKQDRCREQKNEKAFYDPHFSFPDVVHSLYLLKWFSILYYHMQNSDTSKNYINLPIFYIFMIKNIAGDRIYHVYK